MSIAPNTSPSTTNPSQNDVNRLGQLSRPAGPDVGQRRIIPPTSDGKLLCPICRHRMSDFGAADYYLPGIAKMLTPLLRCKYCGAVCRCLDKDDPRGHCDVASYTDPAFEEAYRRQRTRFFRGLISLVARETREFPKSCLDFGCSYGHLLLLLRDMGCETYGIEQCDQARKMCQRHGFHVYPSVDELDGSLQFDLITLIDSLYYVSDPRLLLSDLRKRLTDNGRMLIRIANRNWILNSLNRLGRREYFASWLGDATIGYTRRTLDVLLRNTGYRIVGTHYWEPGKQHSDLLRRMFYLTSSVITSASLGSVVISPGITVIAAKQP
jgi:SAM-dependent methyltransferase